MQDCLFGTDLAESQGSQLEYQYDEDGQLHVTDPNSNNMVTDIRFQLGESGAYSMSYSRVRNENTKPTIKVD